MATSTKEYVLGVLPCDEGVVAALRELLGPDADGLPDDVVVAAFARAGILATGSGLLEHLVTYAGGVARALRDDYVRRSHGLAIGEG